MMARRVKSRTIKKFPFGQTLSRLFLVFTIGYAFFFVAYFVLPYIFTFRYERTLLPAQVVTTPTPVTPHVFVATHIETPRAVKALYMTSWVGGSKELRNPLIALIDKTELNAIVIDIKDYTGRIAFAVEDSELKSIGASENRILDIRGLIADLHARGIYVIGRISSFQDAYLVKKKPEYAVRRKSDNGVWADKKGISWLDAGNKDVWHYLELIGKESYADGFDELNFDYIRFPSDGNMSDIAFPASGNKPKSETLKEFFAFITHALKPIGAKVSADLFGMTTTNKDDLGIGQILEDALAQFDYVAPMVYPSHYPPTFLGFANPAEKPYEVVKYSMDKAVERAKIASSTHMKLRPWLQDFNLGAIYTAPMVRTQIQAVYDTGLNSWMLWNASNRYTASALESAIGAVATTTTVVY